VTLPGDGYLETLKERVVKGQLGQKMIIEDLRPELDALARRDDPDMGRAVKQAQCILTRRQRSLKTYKDPDVLYVIFTTLAPVPV
jgi:hypothetical protein